ncbi:tellurium resistance protein TerZ [Vibrio zhanjiangensis]|uniref:Tellurium resistance protein TerZ n=1 Tax=Vibrio zhanjiangensis TaxID=1046128 RepID=A0ABQ6F2I2_9VIBR|nr:TerD family protein [Vibrio zhanjiangensis]GLT19698.1 tellurium resistance protein TerZ [Vibrio zhanjiangensis]
MSINLSKNSTISLTKEVEKLSKITVGLGWDVAQPKKGFLSFLLGTGSIDLDASCLLIDENHTVLDSVWFGKLKSKCKSVKHKGDNLTGQGDGDDEQICIDLHRLDRSVKHIAITVNSFRGQTFDRVDNAFCRVLDQSSREICRFTLNEQGSHTGIFIGLLSRENQEWKFTTKGVKANGNDVKSIASTVIQHI